MYVKKYELNCDMGEAFGRWKTGPDEEIMPFLDTANIACGFHAGDYSVMRKTVQLAKKHGVRCGAHPGLPDIKGFGRRAMAIAPEEIYELILYQAGALKAFLEAEGMKLEYIKPHGQLFFYIISDEKVMDAAIRAAKDLGVPLVGARSDRYKEKCEAQGVEFVEELYADIDWADDGNLARIGTWNPKTPEMIGEQVRRCALEDRIVSVTGKEISLKFEGKPFTLCIHSDLPGALDNIKMARKVLDELNAAKGLK